MIFHPTSTRGGYGDVLHTSKVRGTDPSVSWFVIAKVETHGKNNEINAMKSWMISEKKSFDHENKTHGIRQSWWTFVSRLVGGIALLLVCWELQRETIKLGVPLFTKQYFMECQGVFSNGFWKYCSYLTATSPCK